MQPDDLILVSVDDHLVEPPDLFEGRLPAAMAEQAPRVVHQDDGTDVWVLQAYNDWHVEDWCGSHPGRFIPLGVQPLWDPSLMAAEARRLATKGCHAVTFSENPEKLGFPSFIDDQVGIDIRDKIGVDGICWEADHPHSDPTWPESPERLAQALDGVPDDEVAVHRNAMREFRFEPFAHRPPEQCTVGALRVGATDVDTSVRSSGQPFTPPEEPVTLVALLDEAAKILEAAGGQK